MSRQLTPEKALIFRIAHVDNVGWDLRNGLQACNALQQNPGFVQIGDPNLIDKRQYREVPLAPHGVLADYVPFYFTPYSPMMYRIRTGWGVPQQPNEAIIIYVSSLPMVEEKGRPYVFTDRHAYLRTARFYGDREALHEAVRWDLLQARDFRRDPDDPEKIERYQAEALVYDHLPAEALLGIICYTEAVAEDLRQQAHALGLPLRIEPRPGWYFG